MEIWPNNIRMSANFTDIIEQTHGPRTLTDSESSISSSHDKTTIVKEQIDHQLCSPDEIRASHPAYSSEFPVIRAAYSSKFSAT